MTDSDYLDAPERCAVCGSIDPCPHGWAHEISTAQRDARMSPAQHAERARWVAGTADYVPLPINRCERCDTPVTGGYVVRGVIVCPTCRTGDTGE